MRAIWYINKHNVYERMHEKRIHICYIFIVIMNSMQFDAAVMGNT